MKKFNVLIWDFNHDCIEHYDILPYFRTKCSKCKNREELKNLIIKKSQYQFWSRCEYEIIIHGWPVHKNEYKIDVHEQIMMNIDIITDILYDELSL